MTTSTNTVNASASCCMQPLYNFHNAGVMRLGKDDSCIVKALKINEDDSVPFKIAKLISIIFTAIANLIGQIIDFCKGSSTPPAVTSLTGDAENTANAASKLSEEVLGNTVADTANSTALQTNVTPPTSLSPKLESNALGSGGSTSPRSDEDDALIMVDHPSRRGSSATEPMDGSLVLVPKIDLTDKETTFDPKAFVENLTQKELESFYDGIHDSENSKKTPEEILHKSMTSSLNGMVLNQVQMVDVLEALYSKHGVALMNGLNEATQEEVKKALSEGKGIEEVLNQNCPKLNTAEKDCLTAALKEKFSV